MSVKAKKVARLVAGSLALTLVSAGLAGCSVGDGREPVRFTFSKREAIEFMTDVVAKYNASQDKVQVNIDTSGVDVVSASFVRGNPPDLMLANYNMEVARFVDRCTLTDLGDTTAASQMKESYQPLLDQYGVCEGRQSALPYSVMAASVIYNKEIFEANGLAVPKTWDELLAVCKKLQDAGITPFYATLKDDWTVGQGWFDYTVGGSIDVLDFFDNLAAQGADVGPNSATSFQKDFADPMDKMQELLGSYINKDAASRGYNDGNLAFAKGQAAMYLQGPWAFSEIAKTSPDLELGTFPLPMTGSDADLKVRVNLDLAAMIPEGSKHQEAARDFLEYLFLPENIEAYNASQLGFTPTTTAPAPNDPRIEGMIEYIDAGRIYQGPSVLVPKTIPVFNYAQAIALGGNAGTYLATMDADWARLAFRAPVRKDS
ncbi:MAG: extracellular solute-binding protein [Tessaracoccus sp.]|uniref:ABC transporter substrate-binding protein n=1 Tax=Tessaracoccus sp. TaxID=1971211 RepID=UPI001EB4E8AC|nr:extracellular solute-binding protein [Tessaracoccus sp.]MBK7822266.1 extracellular solute-binding protein [Tessaracoccus sp.]